MNRLQLCGMKACQVCCDAKCKVPVYIKDFASCSTSLTYLKCY